jgi:hypothetical protein
LNLIAALLALAAPAQASDPEPVPDRIINLTVYGDDPCPQATGEEIVVCARRPDNERYRIPKSLRTQNRPPERSWGSRVEELEEASRGTRPNSCSPNGTYGQTGCFQERMKQWARERRALAR